MRFCQTVTTINTVNKLCGSRTNRRQRDNSFVAVVSAVCARDFIETDVQPSLPLITKLSMVGKLLLPKNSIRMIISGNEFHPETTDRIM